MTLKSVFIGSVRIHIKFHKLKCFKFIAMQIFGQIKKYRKTENKHFVRSFCIEMNF